jgi:biphenyl-2,3-diol 1,2-dioxygenase
MNQDIKLGYLVVEARRPLQWQRFCQNMLGLSGPSANVDGSSGYRLDEAAQRLIVTEGKSDDLAALGLECSDESALDTLLAKLAGAGIAVQEAGEEARRSRRVARLHRLLDPAGNLVELHVGLERADEPFRSELVPGGFATGPAGFGHLALNSSRQEAMERFYVDGLGFGVTERLATRAGPLELQGTFLHCNRRHHSLALFNLPIAKRLHHFMLQANDMRDVGAAFERAGRLGQPMSLSLGQHPDPDGTFSFYGATPSGFDFEIGAGSKEIDPAGWQSMQTAVSSTWGHKPSLRLQLKMAGAIVAKSLRRSTRSDRADRQVSALQ